MAKGVLTIKAKPSYKDIPGVQYHFGRELLDRIEQTLNDGIIFYEPRRPSADLSSRGGRQAYFATATPFQIREDPELADHYFCDLKNYLEFLRPIGFVENGVYYESALQKADGSTNKGKFGQSVRIIPDAEFEAILTAGFAGLLASPIGDGQVADDDEEPLTIDRPLVELTGLKPFRTLAFRKGVREAYDNRCALTGLRLLNTKGNPEVQAAHIRPVKDKGSDSIRNGLALTGTMHWLFDAGLISVAEDMKILIAEKYVPPKVVQLINPTREINLPRDRTHWPHPSFLAHHRTVYFKG